METPEHKDLIHEDEIVVYTSRSLPSSREPFMSSLVTMKAT